MQTSEGRKGPRPPARTDPLWVVVRVPPARTLEFAADMRSEEIMTWTPKVWVRKRLPRRKARRLVLIAVIPGIVFVRDDQYSRLSAMMGSKYWYANPYLFNGDLMKVPEGDLRILAESDNPVKPKPKDARPAEEVVLETFEVGDRVTAVHPLLGTVEGEVAKVLPGDEYSILLDEFFAGRVQLPHFLLTRAAS